MSNALEVTGLEVSRGGRPVLHGVSITVPPGEVTALLGPNGAGKSTLVSALAGLLAVDAGAVHLGARSLAGLRPEAIRRLGLASVPEGHRVLTRLSVTDNLRVAAGRRGDLDLAWDVFPELRRLAAQRAGSLSGGQQQMLALAQALVARPAIILADEMSLGLAPVVVRRLMDVVAQLGRDGVGVLLVEQFATAALGISRRAYVMHRGRLSYAGDAADLVARPDVLDAAYLGTDSGDPAGR